ncbi:ferritin light chain-like [Dama dama]
MGPAVIALPSQGFDPNQYRDACGCPKVLRKQQDNFIKIGTPPEVQMLNAAGTEGLAGTRIRLMRPPGRSAVEAVIQHLLDLHLQACRTYLSLGSPFNRKVVALDDLGEFFCKLALEKLEGTNTLSPMQKQSSGYAPFLEVEKLSHMSRAQPRMLEDTLLIEKNLKQALLDLHGLFSAYAGPRFCLFLEVYFPSEVVKVIRRMGDHLTNLRRPTGPQAGQCKYLTCRRPGAFEE